MNSPLFSQNIIALVWDFDKTLIPAYMQEPLFAHYNVDAATFWREVNALPTEYRRRGVHMVNSEILYLNHILDYTRRGIFKGLNNAKLKAFGDKLDLYPGLPDFFPQLQQQVSSNEEYSRHEISIEHYIVSTGLRQTILGNPIAKYASGVWACEFLEEGEAEKAVINQLGYVLDNTTKTRAVFEINKGVNKHPEEIDVNARFSENERRVPFKNMIYIADGPSDVPVFSVVNKSGGKTYAVYRRGANEQFKQVNQLLRDGRVQSFGEADYQPGSQTYMWLHDAVEGIANRIVSARKQAMEKTVGKAPKHLSE